MVEQTIVEQAVDRPKVEQSSVTNQPLVPEFNNILAWDCEWKRDDLKKNIEARVDGQIYVFCGIDNRGQEIKLHLAQFNHNRIAFMNAILTTMEK